MDYELPQNMRSLPVERTAYYAVQEPDTAQQEAPSLLLALHGWGQSAPRFIRSFSRLSEDNLVVCAPQAPHQFYLDMETKKVGFHWLTVYDRGQAIADTNAFLLRLIQLLEAEREQPFRRILVLGFSQGVSMAWRFAVSGLCKIGGVIHICADLAPDAAEKLAQTEPFPVLLARGADDSMFKESVLLDAQSALSAQGYPVDYIEYAGGHEITSELVDSIRAWVSARCGVDA